MESRIARGTDHARCQEVIITESVKGTGGEKDPVRKVIQVWAKDGSLIAARDSWDIQSSYEDWERWQWTLNT